MTAERSRLTYRFGPLERRGILGPVRAGQAAAARGGRGAGHRRARPGPYAAGALGAIGAFGAGRAARGRAARRVARWRSGCPWRARSRSGAPAAGPCLRSPMPTAGCAQPAAAGTSRCWRRRPTPPPSLRGVRIVESTYRDRPIGALSEQGGRRLTAVLACRVVAFSLLDAEAQERRLARWGLVLSGAADTPIRRIQWIERTAPAQGDELARWLHAERDPAVPLRGTPMIESYLELIGTSARVDPGARDPARGPGRRAAGPRSRRRRRDRGAGRADRARRAGARGGRGHRARRALPPGSSRGRCGPRLTPTPAPSWPRWRPPTPSATGSPRPTPGRSGRGRAGITTAPTAPSTRPTGSAAGRGSRSRRCSWTRCSAGRARCARWR